MMEFFKLEIEPSETLHTKFGTAKIDNKGYYVITSTKENNHMKHLHRLIFENIYGEIPTDCVIHHKNMDKLDNCIFNLEVMSDSDHKKLHSTGKNNQNYGKKLSEDVRKNISKSRNTTGYYKVDKVKRSRLKQGFAWRYSYREDGKAKTFERVNLKDLEKTVKENGLEWEKFQ